MSYYLCFQQQPWTAGYLAGWPSLLRILNFFATPEGVVSYANIFPAYKGESTSIMPWRHKKTTLIRFANVFYIRRRICFPGNGFNKFWRRQLYRWWMWRSRWWSSPPAGCFFRILRLLQSEFDVEIAEGGGAIRRRHPPWVSGLRHAVKATEYHTLKT